MGVQSEPACIGKNRRQQQQQQLCSGTAAAEVAATLATLATVQQGATASSHMKLYVVGAQPYDNKQLCSKSARLKLYDTVNSRSGVGVSTPLICGRKNKASEYIFPSACRSKLRSLRSKSEQIRTHDQAKACHAQKKSVPPYGGI